MAGIVESIPKGYHTITVCLAVRGAAEAIEFYKRAFGAEEYFRMPAPNGKGLLHAELKIGDSRFFLSDECPEGCRSPQSLGGTSAALHLYVADADAAFHRAVKAGASAQMPVQDMFWGDRYGRLVDPFGHEWGIAQRIENPTPDEIRKRGEAWFAETAGACAGRS